MNSYPCAFCGRSCGHVPERWVLTDKGREVLKEIRESQSGADVQGALAGEQGARVGPTV